MSQLEIFQSLHHILGIIVPHHFLLIDRRKIFPLPLLLPPPSMIPTRPAPSQSPTTPIQSIAISPHPSTLTERLLSSLIQFP